MKFGARHLQRSIERHLVFPLSNLIATQQSQFGDLVTVDFDDVIGKLIFLKEAHCAFFDDTQIGDEESTFVPVSVAAVGASSPLR